MSYLIDGLNMGIDNKISIKNTNKVTPINYHCQPY